MATYRVPIIYDSSGHIDVDGVDSIEEALRVAKEDSPIEPICMACSGYNQSWGREEGGWSVDTQAEIIQVVGEEDY